MNRSTVIVVGLFAVPVGYLAACGSSAGDVPSSVDPPPLDDAGLVDRSAQQDADAAGTTEQWGAFDAYDPACRFQVPRSKDFLPAPIAWEPCDSLPATAGKNCRQMVLDWKRSSNPSVSQFYISPATFASKDSKGDVLLHTARYREDGTIRLVANADGPVRMAIREMASEKCVLNAARTMGDYYAFQVMDAEAKGKVSELGGGGLGGRLDDLVPRVFVHAHDSIVRDFFGGAPGFLELLSAGRMRLYSWEDGSFVREIGDPSLEAGRLQNFQVFQGDALFWASDGNGINLQKVWTEKGGAKDFLSFGDDPTRGVADLGTDGHDLVWVEGSSRSTGTGVFPTVSLVAASYTTEPSAVQKRVVRSDLSSYPFGIERTVVGCGFAARTQEWRVSPDVYRAGVLIARLADGRAWHLPDDPIAEWGWRTPLAIGCDEVFVLVFRKAPSEGGYFTVARLKIDSLGEGTPP